MSDPDGAQQMERHETLYFMDGNVILLAPRPDKPALLFRVHKSVLSSHSLIFSDMFDVFDSSGMTSNGGGDHSYDGVPLIHMPDDANHLESVLKIFYYQRTLPWTPYSPHYPALVTPILDLSRKYGIDRTREQILGHLKADWPQTLKDWDKLEREIQFTTNDSSEQRIDDRFPEPASAIKLAHQFDIPCILPAAFYHLSRLSILDDWDKTHADLSILIRNPTKRTARWGLLSAEDFHCLLLGKAEIPEDLRRNTTIGEFGHMPRCNPDGQWKDICDSCIQSADPLALLKIQGDRSYHCSVCTVALKNKIATVRTLFWESLGKYFHLQERLGGETPSR